MRDQLRAFALALAFLTRLGPSRIADRAALGRSVLYYPPVGALLGMLLVLPFLADAFPTMPLVRAWCYTLLGVWLTRALHLDGLADLADALGSGRQGEDFH
ncbi:adenosylcobinamide-GDP ribazoletransferase, partial [Desulfovibrio sp. OttesenSCG-928-A18]|nr:adenosylcobinamide-GDP ribazoletransferase [Desulfovibrio sp. OttesenSCG-928-A18]